MSKSVNCCFLIVIILCISVGCSKNTNPEPATGAALIYESNLLENETFWPYRVTLVSDWQTPSDSILPQGTTGILIRVEEDGRARIDFGRDGLYAVPSEKTDLIEQANRILAGETEKEDPNFVAAIGQRLLASDELPPRALGTPAIRGRAGFLLVFADPTSAEFEALANGLASFQSSEDIQTLVFPQGRHSDVAVAKRLQDLNWRVPFVFAHLSEPYTQTLLSDATLPAVILQTVEGRVVLQETWTPQLPELLTAAFAERFPAAKSVSSNFQSETSAR